MLAAAKIAIVLQRTFVEFVSTIVELFAVVAERVHRLPAWVGLDDIAAAMSGSVAVIATTTSSAVAGTPTISGR